MKNKPMVSFLILHYQTEDDTIECVDSILDNVEYDNYNIVIVDNGSPNNSGKQLDNKYKENVKIKVIISDKNLGFAKGNNLGFNYIKKHFDSDFIVMINNDTIIKDKDFLKGIIEEYYNSRYDILGPKIISLVDNQNLNPGEFQFKNSKQVNNSIYKINLLLFLEYIYLYKPIKRLYKILKRTKGKNKNFSNTKLHGSCLIFSKDYIKSMMVYIIKRSCFEKKRYFILSQKR